MGSYQTKKASIEQSGQLTEWEKMVSNYPDKGLIYRTYRKQQKVK
jgi:hypothetical protein